MHFVCGVMTFLPVFTGFCTFLPVYTVVMCETVFTWYKPNPVSKTPILSKDKHLRSARAPTLEAEEIAVGTLAKRLQGSGPSALYCQSGCGAGVQRVIYSMQANSAIQTRALTRMYMYNCYQACHHIVS